MAGSMQILALENIVYELEEKVKKISEQMEGKFVLQDKKFEKYEKFLKSFEGGASLPAKTEGVTHTPGKAESKYGVKLKKSTEQKKKIKSTERKKKIKRREKVKEKKT